MNLMLGVTLRRTSVPSRGQTLLKFPSSFTLQKPEINSGLMGHLARLQTLSQEPREPTDSEHKLIVVNCCLSVLRHNWRLRESLIDSTSKDAGGNALAQN